MLYRLNFWAYALPESFAPLLAQVETIVEKAVGGVMKGGTDFGNSTDAVRFGITIFALFAGLGTLAYLYERKNLNEIRELKLDNKALREKIDANNESHQEKYDELRDACDKKTSGYWGVVQAAVKEVAALTQAMLNAGIQIPRPPLSIPPQPPEQSSVRSAFLPAGPRRVPRRPNDPREDEN